MGIGMGFYMAQSMAGKLGEDLSGESYRKENGGASVTRQSDAMNQLMRMSMYGDSHDEKSRGDSIVDDVVRGAKRALGKKHDGMSL